MTDVIDLDLFGFSCALGGSDGRTLFIVANEWRGHEHIGTGPRTGHVYTVNGGRPASGRALAPRGAPGAPPVTVSRPPA